MTSPASSLILLIAVIGAIPAFLLAAIVRTTRVRARALRSLEEDGYRVHRVEARFLTRGPFERARLAGSKHGDSLYRVAADDRTGSPCVVWIRVPAAMFWHPLVWETRRDELPNRPRGISALAFYSLLV